MNKLPASFLVSKPYTMVIVAVAILAGAYFATGGGSSKEGRGCISSKISWPARLESTKAPDFSALSGVDRKEAFLGYFVPIIENNNKRILAKRDFVAQAKAHDGALCAQDIAKLSEIFELYHIPFDADAPDFDVFLNRVDEVPVSLVVSQGAWESGWGTSRFATEANNYFGEWCFSEGCGLVPSNRAPSKTHEVRVFDAPSNSVGAYFFNLNHHRAYEGFRAMRREFREEGKALDAGQLALQLGAYSELGSEYLCMVLGLMQKDNVITQHFPPSKETLAVHC